MKKIVMILGFLILSITIKAQFKPDIINSMGGSAQYAGGYLAFSVGEPIIGTTSGSNFSLTQGFLQTWKALVKQLVIKVFLEGLYSTGGIMNQARGISSPQFGAGIADKVTFELHEATSPYNLVYTFINADLNINGNVTINNIPSYLTGSYYLVVKHRNSVETWSSDVIDLNGTGIFTYDFSIAATKAYGNNQKQMAENIFAIYGGDGVLDGFIDASDMAAIDNAGTAIQRGYFPEDVNGDGIVDASDMALVDNNSTAVVHLKRP
jgi:hypothetical protein